jgi:hypothetical protein
MEDHLAKFDLKVYAKRGAEARVAELQAELAQIYRAFPDMRRRRQASNSDTNSGTERLPSRRRRTGMSAAQKKAVSIRMKKYWAERRKAHAR